MARVYAQRARSGYKLSRGTVIEKAQRALTEAGHDTKGTDGIFGRDTETALRSFQSAFGLGASGALDDATWSSLLPSTPPPSDFELAIGLTSVFEGHGYTKVVGNFDGAGLTWGVIGFTLSHGELPILMNAIDEKAPGALDAAFGDLAPVLREKMTLPRREAVEWADSISLGRNKTGVEKPWADAFKALGKTDAAKEAQLDRAKARYWATAERDAAQFGLTGTPGLALCFDIAVQNGGINEDDEIMAAFNEEPDATQRRKREIVAEEVALGSRPRFQDDVRSRKMTIATGEGIVHGGRFHTADWGISG
jgi:peptidoglycan hydrolase-like protein with peptidoglycan-binding domain